MSSNSPQKPLPHLAGMDGLRAVAILAVVLFHIWPSALPGGFTGVDVFLVLSGFLITRLILDDIRADRFSLKEFYLRRIQRLLPNLTVTILVVLLIWRCFFMPSTAMQPAWHALWTLFNLSNFYNWLQLGGYWGTDAAQAPFTHFWSLGVEEQFYLLFPGCLLLLIRIQAKRLRTWLAVVALISFAGYLYGTRAAPTATFYLLPTRAWEFLIGAILAAHGSPGGLLRLHRHLQNPKATEAFGWIGLALIFSGYVFIHENRQSSGLLLLAPTLGTALVILSVVNAETRLSRLLSLRPFAGIGKLSYSLYLWHWPLITFGKLQAEYYGQPPLTGATLGAAAGVLLSWIAYKTVEQPFRRRAPGRDWRLAVITTAVGITALVCGVLAIRPPAADPHHRFDPIVSYFLHFDSAKSSTLDLARDARFSDVEFPPHPPRAVEAWRTGGIIHRYGGGQPQVVVFGSSHALMYSKLIDDLCRERHLSVAFLGAGKGKSAFFETLPSTNFPTKKEAEAFNEARRNALREWRPAVLFIIDRWEMHAASPAEFDGKLRAFLRETTPWTGRVVFVAQVPVAEQGDAINLREFINWHWDRSPENRGPRLAINSKEPHRRQLVATAEAATLDFKNLEVLRADRLFHQPDGSLRYAEGRRFFYGDDDHLTQAGAEEAGPLFKNALREINTPPPAPR